MNYIYIVRDRGARRRTQGGDGQQFAGGAVLGQRDTSDR